MGKKIQDIIIFLNETTSTNRYLQDLSQVEKLMEGTSVLALYQTAGRGHDRNRWESERGKNVLLSSIFYPDVLPVTKQFYLSEITSVSILQALKEETDSFDQKAASEFSIKWPNDIYWRDKKIAGILIENVIENNRIKQSIIGAGINVNQEKFVSDAPNPVSLKQIFGMDFNIHLIFTRIIKNLHFNYIKFLKNELPDIHSFYMDNLYRKDGMHPYQTSDGEKFYASVKRIEPFGALVLETEDGGEKSFLFKEIEFLE
ncbi:MAG: biotin--[acetyl-CoA-carboxylase] ligase [Candidatus Azobacteroides sp.]|nr:biotin--[acetyl-CoA-carboxylase] ligase [Candidatus Azobacteroides sp.]